MKVELTLKIEGNKVDVKEYFNMIERDSRMSIEAQSYLNPAFAHHEDDFVPQFDLSVTKRRCKATKEDLIQLIEILNRI